MSAVIVHDLWKRYGATEAVRGVSFSVEPGEVFGLLGPNGAGKTSTIECLIGLREADSGRLTVCGLDARKEPRAVKQKIGVALQSTALQDKVTPREALRLFGSFYRAAASPEELLERFGLVGKADAPYDSLSGGQRQRLALALAFVNRPEVVLLDEPTTGLDPQARQEVHAEILRMKRDGHTVLLSTHYLEEAEQLCDRVAIVDRGRVIRSGSPRELMASQAGPTAITLTLSSPALPGWFDGVDALEQVTTVASQLRFTARRPAAALAAVAGRLVTHQVEIVAIDFQRASLEEVFLQLTQSPVPLGKPSSHT